MEKQTISWTWISGLAFFGAAIFFFCYASKDFGKKAASNPPFSSSVEWGSAVFVFLLAAFLRLWRLDTIPPGLFVDQGYQGYIALQILHEGVHPFFDHGLLKTSALFLYELADWFLLFGASEWTSRFFFVLVSLAALPFIYWTFRELAGPRAALIAFFILAVLRWHLNLSRWGFYGIHNYFFMSAGLAPLLYALRTGRRRSFWMAGILLGGGMYYYAAYYIFPVLVLVYLAYESNANRDQIRKLKRPLLAMAGIFLLALAPLLAYGIFHGGTGERMGEVSVFSLIQKQNSLRPLLDNLIKFGLMFNRRGDANLRHNFQLSPMLDGLTAAFFTLGLFLALRSWKDRKHFYCLAGLAFLSLPGLLSVEMPHAARLMGIVPFVALIAAFPLSNLWENLPAMLGRKERFTSAFLFGIFLTTLAWQNINAYFNLQMRNPGGWYWWDPVPTEIGRRILKKAGTTDFYVTPRCLNHDTIRFIAYPFLNNYKNLFSTDTLPVFPSREKMGLEYVLEPQRQGTRNLVKSLFPECREETLVDPAGNTSCYFYDVTADVVDKGRGLTGTFHPSGEVSRFVHFPEDLPNGPFHGDFKGCVFLPESGKYRLGFIGTASISLNMGGKRIMPGKEFMAPAGYYGIQISVLAPPGKCSLGIILQTPNGNEMNLDSTQLTTLPLNFGLLATYHSSHAGFYDQEFYIWEQVIDYDNRYAYPFLSQGAAERVEPVHWAGKLMAEKAGWYILRPWTTGKTYLSIDGKKYYFPEKCPGMRIHLSRGFHPFSIDSPDNPNNFNFSWLPPGQTDFSVVPFQAFGTTQLF